MRRGMAANLSARNGSDRPCPCEIASESSRETKWFLSAGTCVPVRRGMAATLSAQNSSDRVRRGMAASFRPFGTWQQAVKGTRLPVKPRGRTVGDIIAGKASVTGLPVKPRGQDCLGDRIAGDMTAVEVRTWRGMIVLAGLG